MNVLEATQKWVREFNEYPRDMLQSLIDVDPESWEEVTDIEEENLTYMDAPFGCLPMWGWLWSFKDVCDVHWMDEDDGIKLMSEAGFRVYRHEEWGCFFGLDGGGYDFYEQHWIPAYKKRGLQWHDKEVTDD